MNTTRRKPLQMNVTNREIYQYKSLESKQGRIMLIEMWHKGHCFLALRDRQAYLAQLQTITSFPVITNDRILDRRKFCFVS